MDENELRDLIVNEDMEDEILYLKPEFEIVDSSEDSNPEMEETEMEKDVKETSELENTNINWKCEMRHEPCAISVHPQFPQVAHVAVGNCGDYCSIYDFDSNNSNTNNGELLVLDNFEETVSCVKYSNCGSFLGLGCLDGNLFVYSKNGNDYTLLKKVENQLDSVEWLCFSKDSHLLVASGNGGILVIYELLNDSLQVININFDSSVGSIVTYKEQSNVRDRRNAKENAEYNVVCGCKESNLVVVTLNQFHKHVSTNRIGPQFTASEPTDQVCQDEVISLTLHQKLKFCAYGTLKGNVTFVNMNRKTVFKSHNQIHKDSVESILFTNSESGLNDSSVLHNDLVISVGLDGLIVFYDLSNFNKLNVIDLGFGLTKLVVHPSNNLFLVSTVNGTLVTFNPRETLKEVKCHNGPILDVQLLKLGPDCYTISISEDKTMAICSEVF